MKMIVAVCILWIGGIGVTPAVAMAVFDLVGDNPGAADHPTGVGKRSASGFWGISSTGGGFMDGRIVFNHAFALPMTSGTSIPFDAADLAMARFNHIESAFEGGGAIAPVFSFSATGAQIVEASGLVVNNDGTYLLTNVYINTSVTQSLFRLPGGIVAGTMYFENNTVGINVDTIGGVIQPAGTKAALVLNSEYPGDWRLVDVPEPVSMITGLAMAMIVRVRRRESPNP